MNSRSVKSRFMSTENVLEITDLEFGWRAGTTLLDISSFNIPQGTSVFLKGPSGSGKSTLLGLIGGVLELRSGSIVVSGAELASASPAKKDRIRADNLGIIFQQFNLLPYLSVLGNITLPCRFSSRRRKTSEEKFGSPNHEARHLVAALGLPDEIISSPVAELSVGQQQRVAVARALIGGPKLIIADEPTSALDSENRDLFIELLNEQRSAFNSSLLFVSHDSSLAGHFDRQEELVNLNRSTIEVET